MYVKTKIYIVVVLALICAIIFGGIYQNKKSTDTAYNYAIALIQNGSYEGALGKFEEANPNILDRKDFKLEMKHGRLNECYKNTLPLYAYALAQQEYNSEDRHMQTVNDYLELISADYRGELSEEIESFKEIFKSQYEEFLSEQKRQEEEKMKVKREQEDKRLRNSVPYVGMSESRIGDTILGRNYEVLSDYEWEKGEKIPVNIYYFKEGGAIIFVAKCMRGNVFYVNDDRDEPWILHSNRSHKNEADNDNPYNVNDYDTPEEFYDDNYTRFWNEDEAIDFYNRYHEDP